MLWVVWKILICITIPLNNLTLIYTGKHWPDYICFLRKQTHSHQCWPRKKLSSTSKPNKLFSISQKYTPASLEKNLLTVSIETLQTRKCHMDINIADDLNASEICTKNNMLQLTSSEAILITIHHRENIRKRLRLLVVRTCITMHNHSRDKDCRYAKATFLHKTACLHALALISSQYVLCSILIVIFIDPETFTQLQVAGTER